jgi:hypothetical protein
LEAPVYLALGEFTQLQSSGASWTILGNI